MGREFDVKGDVIGERQVTVQRRGVIVTEYLVKPDVGFTNLSKHVVNEGDVIELKVCPGCNGVGHIAIHNGDDDVSCPICGESDEVVF
jgi:hypothetical protein